MKITNMTDAVRYLEKYIAPPSRIFQGDLGLKRMKYLLQLVGDPQEKIKVIHVAGTSGKGSTCYYISSLLHHHGLNVGLTVSPHIHNIRERVQINNEPISEDEFCVYVSKIIPYVEQMRVSDMGSPTYFEIMMAIEFLYFKERNVDYAVIETGLGGQFDASNTVRREDKVCVITKIGFDHTKVLGNTLSKIAYQKAKIIQKKNIVISTDQRIQVQNVINRIADEQSTKVMYLSKKNNFKTIHIDKAHIVFDFSDTVRFKQLELGTEAVYQVENASLALYTVLRVFERDKFSIDEKKIRIALQQTRIPGRMEIVIRKGRKFIVDGAHNPQKMRAFLNSLSAMYPDQKFEFLVAFKRDKDVTKMIKMIIPFAKRIMVTDFLINDTMVNLSLKPEEIVNILIDHKFKEYKTVPGTTEAFERMAVNTKEIGVVTGSMYLTSAFLSHNRYYAR